MSAELHIACVARGNDVAGARVLAAMLRASGVGSHMTTLVLPGLRPTVRPDDEPFRVLTPADLGSRPLEHMLAIAPEAAVEALARPLLVDHLLNAGNEAVLLMPADAEVFGRPVELEDALRTHDAVLVPRLRGSLPDDGHRPDGADLLDAGEIDDAFVAVRATEGGRAFATWWADRALESADAAPAVRRKDDAPVVRLFASPLATARRVFAGLGVLEDAGYGVSYWNLHERRLASDDGALTADGRPLRIMRFAGFRADRPWWLSEHATRVLVLDDPVLLELCANRAAALRDAGWINMSALALRREQLPNGLVFDERLRRLYAEALDGGEDFDLFSPSGAEAFTSWLLEPSPRSGQAGLNRYVYHVWRDRPDLQEAYPEFDGSDAEGFAGWAWVHGRPECKLQPALLPPRPAWVDAGATVAVPAVMVAGYLRGNLGLGEAARGYVEALTAAGVPVCTRSISPDPPVERLPRGARQRPEQRVFEDLALPDGIEPSVNLICVNADQVPEFVAEVGGASVCDRYTIGLWAWETDVIPERWDISFGHVDEVWTYSRYVAEHIARAGDVPVVVIPPPVVAPDPAGATVPFPLPDRFLFLFAFDFFSTMQRKNPLGLVDAFTRAFAPGDGPVLLLKTINADFRPEARERLRYRIGDRDDILLIDAALTPDELAALYVRADCYVSLHRAEGFGLTLAEAMALGKPVVATGFSANTDFMTATNSYLVDWTSTEVGAEAEHYPAEGIWAEPSIEHAAAQLQAVWTDRAEAHRRGTRARADVEAALSPAVVGALARARLERIATLRGRHPPRPSDDWRALPELPERLQFDLGGRAGGGPRGLARRAVFRALRPYTTSERRLDEAIVASLRRLQLELTAERAARERDRLRLVRLEQHLAELSAKPR